jgi:Flp pilus assembly pilin Flp
MTVTSVVCRLKELVKRASSEEGQAMVEYALLISLISIVGFVSVQAFGLGVYGLYSKINDVYP